MRRRMRVCMIGMGRTGQEIAAEIIHSPDMELVMAVCGGHNPSIGEDVSVVTHTEYANVTLETANTLLESISAKKPDVAIDFSTPEAVMLNAKKLAKTNVNHVIGTTGFTEIQLNRLKALTEKYGAGIVYAPNITLGVNVLMTLVNISATLLEEYDLSIIETHFKKKKDSPSGTAVKIAEQARNGIAARAKNADADDVPVLSVRSGGIIGRHSVVMAGEYDRVEIAHESFSRKAFAAGALRAARFVVGRRGWFEMRDVLDLENALKSYLDNDAPGRMAQ